MLLHSGYGFLFFYFILFFIYVFVFQSKFDIPQDEIAREIINRHNLKRLGDQWRNWKHALKAKYFDKSKTATQIVAEAPNIVNRQDYAKLVDSWFRGNTIKIMHMRRYVFVIIFLFQ